MIRGISFISENSYSIFPIITRSIKIKDYDWYVIENGVYDGKTHDSALKVAKYNGASLKNCLESDEIFVLYANIQAYPLQHAYKIINSYDDYFNSDCEIVILIYDSLYIEIYSKDIEIIKCIEYYIHNNGFNEISYITDNNDSRTAFYVMK